VNTNENPRWFMQINRVVPLRHYYLNVRVFNVLHSDELSLDSNLFPVSDSTNIQAFEVLNRVLVAHPEGAIMLLLLLKEHWPYCLFD
jgi:hypothetical protein